MFEWTMKLLAKHSFFNKIDVFGDLIKFQHDIEVINLLRASMNKQCKHIPPFNAKTFCHIPTSNTMEHFALLLYPTTAIPCFRDDILRLTMITFTRLSYLTGLPCSHEVSPMLQFPQYQKQKKYVEDSKSKA